MNKKLLALLLAFAMVFTLVSCGGQDQPSTQSTADQQSSSAAQGTTAPTTQGEPTPADEGTYTYNDVWAAQPNNWNPHAWEMSHESDFMDYTVAPFTYSTFDGNGGWYYAYDAATAVTDITATFADKEKYGVPADATEKYVYEIKLRPEMKWDTGESITADDYVYSMKMMLDPKMKNYRSNSYTSGESEIANAALYFNNDKAGKPVYKDVKDAEIPEGAKLYVTMVNPIVFFGDTAKAYYENESHTAKFTVNDVNLFEKYSAEDYVEFNEEEMKADLNAIAAAFGDNNEEAYKEFLVYDDGEVYPETPWEEVGLVKVDDYTILYIVQRPLEPFYMHSALTSNWLVHKETYEANFTEINDLVATDYCTKLENTRSCGPYMVESFENDKQIVLVRNPYYWAYKDGQFNPENGMYRADKVVIDIVQDTGTHEGLFLSGKSDALGLNSDQIPKYRKSTQISFVDETYTLREIFATSLESLQSRDQEKGSGKRVALSNKNFRKALSRSIDRAKFCDEATSGFKPAYFLLNRLYYYDMANDPNSVYRDSKYAKMAVLNLYEVEYTDETVDAEYAKITGRDLGEAKELFQKAYDELVEAGLYTEGEEVPIEIMVTPSELSPQHIKQQELLNQFYNEGAAGTPFEGKIKVIYESGDKKRYDNVATGKNMAIHGAWGGAAFYPFSTIRVYTNPTYMGGLNKIHESNGWNPSEEQLEMTIKRADGTTVTESRTFEDWSNQINGDGEYTKDATERLQVLAQLETGILNAYQCIPIGTYTAASLISYKVSNAMEDYHIMYGFGGFRYLNFNYNDAEWAEFVKENNNQINYE